MIFELTVLGSGSALPTSRRNPTAQVLNILERFFLIDCGEGTQLQLRKNNIKFSKIDNIFISHVHGDHVFGLFGLLSTFNLLGRRKALVIYGPEALQTIIGFFKENFAENLAFQIEFKVIGTKNKSLIYSDKCVEVYAFPLKHRIETYGYLFREKKRLRKVKKGFIDKFPVSIKQIADLKEGEDIVLANGTLIKNMEATIDPAPQRSYAYCSDTAYFEGLSEIVKNVDLLFHEATFLGKDAHLAKKTGHSTAFQAAQIAKNARVKKLIIGHFSARYNDLSEYLTEACKVFEHTYIANDDSKFDVPIAVNTG